VTTTTIPVPTCSPESSPSSLRCRIGLLQDDIVARGDLGQIKTALQNTLVRAETALVRTEDQLVAGTRRRAVASMRKAVKALKVARKRLSTRAAIDTVPAETRELIGAQLDTFRSEARSLVATLRVGSRSARE
jgi:hypothetical protein